MTQPPILPADHRLQPSERTDLHPYRVARAVELRAANSRSDKDQATRAAIERLSNVLRSDRSMRTDVLPGYYLDIRI